MSELQKQIQAQNILQQNIVAIMQQFDISAFMMDDILSKISLQVKDLIIQEISMSLADNESSNEQNTNEEEINNVSTEEVNNKN